MGFVSLSPLLGLRQPQDIVVVLLAVLIPLSIFVGGRNVRLRRLRVLDNLAAALFPSTARPLALPPSFELIRARYKDGENQPVGQQVLAGLKEIGIYLLQTVVFILVSAPGGPRSHERQRAPLRSDWPSKGADRERKGIHLLRNIKVNRRRLIRLIEARVSVTLITRELGQHRSIIHREIGRRSNVGLSARQRAPAFPVPRIDALQPRHYRQPCHPTHSRN